MFELISALMFTMFSLFFVRVVYTFVTHDHVVWPFAHRGVKSLSFLYSFDRRSSMLLPFLKEESFSVSERARGYMCLKKEDPFPMEVELFFRTEKNTELVHSKNPPRNEFVYMRAHVTLPSALVSGLQIGVVTGDEEHILRERLDHAVTSQAFDPAHEQHYNQFILRCDDAGVAREMSVTVDEIRYFLMPLEELERVFAMQQSIDASTTKNLPMLHPSAHRSQSYSTAMSVYGSLSPRLNMSHGSELYQIFVSERLCWLECHDTTFHVEFVGECEARASSANARDMVDRWLQFVSEHAPQFVGGEPELSWLDYAITRAHHDESPVAVREFAIKFALIMFELKDRYDSSPLKSVETCVRQLEDVIDMDALLPLLSSDYLKEHTDTELEALTHRTTHESVIAELVKRSSELEFLHNARVSWAAREVVLKTRMRMRLSFVNQAEEIVKGIGDGCFSDLIQMFILDGWDELWAAPWLREEMSARVCRVDDGKFHARLQDLVHMEKSYSEQQYKSMSRYHEMLDSIYHHYIFDVEDEQVQQERLHRIIAHQLFALMLRDENDASCSTVWPVLLAASDGLDWETLLHHPRFNREGTMVFQGFVREPVDALAYCVDHAKLRDMVESNPNVRLSLLNFFKQIPLSGEPVAVDRVAEHLFCGEATFFSLSLASDTWEAAIITYMNHVERQGVRPTALKALNVIQEKVPPTQLKLLRPRIVKWTDALSEHPESMGLLTAVSAQNDRRGGLSVDTQE